MGCKFKNILLTSILAMAGIFGVSATVIDKQVKEEQVVEKAEAEVHNGGLIHVTLPDEANATTRVTIHHWRHSYNWSEWDKEFSNEFSDWYGHRVFYGDVDNEHEYWQAWYWQGSDRKYSKECGGVWKTHLGISVSGWEGSNWTIGEWTVRYITFTYDGNGSTGGSTSSTSNFKPDNKDSTLATNGFSKTGYTFAGWNTERDGSGYTFSSGGKLVKEYATDTTTLYDGASITLYAQWAPAAGRWLVGNFDGCNWGIEGAVCTPNTGTQYEGVITLGFGDKFKSANYNGSDTLSDYYGYSLLLGTCGAYKYFSNDGDDNIVCYARGTYNVYVTTGDFGGGKKISIELSSSVNAEHLAAKLMNFAEYAGHCGDNDRFPAMRTIYLGLSSDEQSTFQGYSSSETAQFLNAYNRYTAWARALGENPWENAKASSAIRDFSPLSLFGEEDNLSTVIIIVASSVALLSVTALSILVIKKRKNKEE